MFEPDAVHAPSIKRDILSGLTVSFALVPEGLAFGFVAGVDPLVSMYAAFFICLITSLLGGRPGMISGAAGALAVVMVSLVAEHGVQYLFAAVVLMGALQILAGLFKLGKFIRMVPHPVMLGFVNGLAIVIFIAQLTQFGENGSIGWANVVTGFFGGMGGCAMIGQSMINMSSGGRGRLSGVIAALAILAFILFAAPLIEMIPMAVLVGVMFIVVLGTFEWSSFRIIRRILGGDAFVLVLVSVVTVLTDLAVAVISGVIVSALIFAWERAKSIRVERQTNQNGSSIYKVNGPLFFGSTTEFLAQFSPREDCNDVIIDFGGSRVCDHSGLDAVDSLAERYMNAGKQLHLIHLNKDCRALLKKAGSLVEPNVVEDPTYFVATNA